MSERRINDFSNLPTSVRDIAETLGIDVVFKLVEHFGGCEVRVPAGLRDGHPLLAIGEDAARALCAYCPNDRIDVPKSLDPKPSARLIEQLEQRGLTRSEIARELNISQRHVRRIANGEPAADPDQMSLLD